MKALGNKSLSAILAMVTNIIWWIEWIGCSAIVTVGIITAIVKKEFTLSLPVSFSAEPLTRVVPLNKDFPAGIVNTSGGDLLLNVHASVWNVLLLLLVFVTISAIIIIITYQVKMIFLNLTKNLAFSEPNILRLRNIAFVLIAYSVLQWITVIALNQILVSNLNWGQLKLTYSFNLGCLLTGVILIIVAGIFKQGVSLEEENSLTI